MLKGGRPNGVKHASETGGNEKLVFADGKPVKRKPGKKRPANYNRIGFGNIF
jgi:hypothetical protein